MKPLKKIMYVEDEADIRQIAQLALEAIGGFEVLLCESGQQALEQAVAFEPDMILLDVMMPGMDGPTTLAKLRELPQISQVPVAFMTAKVQPDEVKQLLSLRVLDVIAKPFDPMQLSTLIEKIWNQQ
ncbi:MAG: response regulator [Gammaproteobacteria bacterium]|nr:response regulator [Gammaproteobacteria bacterium]